jgi:hypothetical protein
MCSDKECQLLRRLEGKATRNAGDSVAKYQERTTTVCDNVFQTVQEKQ